MLKKILILSFICINYLLSAQEKEINPPFYIKTISFFQNGQNEIPIFKLGDSFQIQFDDLHGTEDNYYYTIKHCDYDWNPSQLSKNEYLIGFDDQRIIDYSNSFNTLQIYSHYRVSFPNKNTQFKVSGNYIISILDENKEVVFSKKIILFEEIVSVPIQIKRARDVKNIEQKHNIDFSIKTNAFTFQSPLQNVKVLLMQNGQFDSAITNIKPMYTIGNDLIYKYDKETQFWAGNEYLFFENKNIQGATNSVAYVSSEGGLYNSHLYPNYPRTNLPYTYWPDINGNFLVNSFNRENPEIESDYAWVYFTLAASLNQNTDSIYIAGMFNNYALNEESKMEFNQSKGVFEKAMMIKQGFTNYKYIIANSDGNIDYENTVDGNFYQTENNYSVLVYYRENNQRYDRVIGKGSASSINITN